MKLNKLVTSFPSTTERNHVLDGFLRILFVSTLNKFFQHKLLKFCNWMNSQIKWKLAVWNNSHSYIFNIYSAIFCFSLLFIL